MAALSGQIRAFPNVQIDQRSQNPRRLFYPALDEKGEFIISVEKRMKQESFVARFV